MAEKEVEVKPEPAPELFRALGFNSYESEHGELDEESYLVLCQLAGANTLIHVWYLLLTWLITRNTTQGGLGKQSCPQTACRREGMAKYNVFNSASIYYVCKALTQAYDPSLRLTFDSPMTHI